MIITAGKFKGQKITAPDEAITRPTLSKVRMAVFNTLQALLPPLSNGGAATAAGGLFEGRTFLDMYAGSGIMGLEALSRGFERAVFIEKNPKSAQILKKNLAGLPRSLSLAGNDAVALTGDSLKLAPRLDGQFDVIYIDPPYYAGIYEQSLAAAAPVCKGIIILEHTEDVDYTGFTLIKQKKYGKKFITFLTK
jgi:16S rRNA (guanine966-N2)-methyltransferase